MSMPNIPDIAPEISINSSEVKNLLLASIALEEISLAHLVNAEAEKLQYVLGTLENSQENSYDGPLDVTKLLEINESVQKTLRSVIKKEILLEFKLEEVLNIREEEYEEE